jgi:CopG family transcriptional regulator, nickel-responsive regulator
MSTLDLDAKAMPRPALRRWPLVLFSRQRCYSNQAHGMTRLVRFGVSIEEELLRRFDRLVAGGGAANRSEALRDLIRGRLVEEEVSDETAEGFGVLTLVYDHHRRELQERLTQAQHAHGEHIIATTHVHIDHHRCLEVILLRGPVGAIRELATALGGFKGVQHSRLVLTAGDM